MRRMARLLNQQLIQGRRGNRQAAFLLAADRLQPGLGNDWRSLR